MDLIKVWTQVLILLLVPLLLVLSAYLTIAFFEVAANVPFYSNILVIGERTTTLAAADTAPSGESNVAGVASALGESAQREAGIEPEPKLEPEPSPEPPVATPAVVSEEIRRGEIEELLTLHNDVRSDLGIPPLVWSPALARSAGDFADTLAEESCSLRHSYSGYGENIYYSRKYGSDQTPRTPEEVMREFIREAEYYDHDTHTCEPGKICGHYTQIIWSDTTAVGCAKSACISDEREEVWVCHYAPAGNVEDAQPF